MSDIKTLAVNAHIEAMHVSQLREAAFSLHEFWGADALVTNDLEDRLLSTYTYHAILRELRRRYVPLDALPDCGRGSRIETQPPVTQEWQTPRRG